MLKNIEHTQNSAYERSSHAGYDMSQADEINLGELFQSLWRHRWKIFLVVTLALLAGFFLLTKIDPRYTARAEILLLEEKAPIDFGSGLLADGSIDKEIATEIEVVRSRDIIRTVIERHDLLQDPEFNPDMLGETGSSWLAKTGVWPVRVHTLFPPDIEFGAPETPEIRSDDKVMRDAIDTLLRGVKVGNINNTNILWLTVETYSPQKSALIANTIAAAYLEARMDFKREAQRIASDFIGESVVELREEVEAAEAAVASFQSTHGLLVEASEEATLQYEEFQLRAKAARDLATGLRARLERYETALQAGGGLREAARALEDSRLNALLRAGYNEELREEMNQVEARLRTQLEAADRRASLMEANLAEMEASFDEDVDNIVELRQLQREAEASRQLLENFLARQQETSIQQGFISSNARILTSAEPPDDPSSPRKPLIIGLFGMGGLISAAILVFILERSRNRFVTIEELETWSGMTVMGAIPRLEKARSRKDVLMHVQKSPASAIAEAIRNLRTSILLANPDSPPQVITFTSSVAEEGKSLTTIMLATVTSQMGRTALLVDVDFRRRTLHDTLGLGAGPGLIAVLNNKATLGEAVRVDPETGLHALMVEENRVSAPDLLSSQAFQDFLDEARQHYDMILLDAPPVLPVTDARILAKMSDALIYVVKWNDTPRDVVRHGLSSLSGLGIHVSGLVLSQIDRKKQKRYGYGDYGYYGYGSQKHYEKANKYYTE